MRDKSFQVLIIFLVVAVVLAGWQVGQRYLQERNNRQVEAAVWHEDVLALAQLEGMTYSEMLEKCRAAGVSGVAFKEQTLETLRNEGSFTVWTGSQLALLDHFSAGSKEWMDGLNLDSSRTYLLTGDAKRYRLVSEHLRAKTEGVETYSFPGEGLYLISSPLSYHHLDKIGLGIPSEAEEAAAQGLHTAVQIRSWPDLKTGDLENVMELYSDVPNLSLVFFNDPEVPGYPEYIRKLAVEVEKTGVPVGLVEFYPQKGLNQTALCMDKKAVRVHTIAVDEINNYTPARAADRYLLAAAERNARFLVLRMFFSTEYQDLLDTNLSFLEQVTTGLKDKGLTIGVPSLFPGLEVSRKALFFIGLGPLAGAVFLGRRAGVRRWLLPCSIVVVCVWFLFLWWDVQLARKLMALVAAVVFPALAIVTGIQPDGGGIRRSIRALLYMSGVSLVGALLVVGLLAGTDFMLKMDQFSGIKIAYLLPLLLAAGILAVKLPGEDNWFRRLRGLLDQPVALKYLIVLTILGLFGMVYLLRAGNETQLVSDLEIRFRAFLDQVLLVRPRTKEFLIGHPALILAAYLGYSRRATVVLPLVFLGAMGQVSLVNTFCHLHTPLTVSLLRTFNGLWTGIIVGLLVIGGYHLWLRLERRWERG